MSGPSISKEDVKKIAKLARLELTEAELTLYQQRLGRVLDYVNVLNQVPTDTESPTSHVPKDAVAFREDRVVPFGEITSLMENAPKKQSKLFLLPTIMDQD